MYFYVLYDTHATRTRRVAGPPGKRHERGWYVHALTAPPPHDASTYTLVRCTTPHTAPVSRRTWLGVADAARAARDAQAAFAHMNAAMRRSLRGWCRLLFTRYGLRANSLRVRDVQSQCAHGDSRACLCVVPRFVVAQRRARTAFQHATRKQGVVCNG